MSLLLLNLSACEPVAHPVARVAAQLPEASSVSFAGRIEFVAVERRATSQFGNLLEGGFEVAEESGSALAMHLRLVNETEQPLEYLAFYDCHDPLFTATHRVADHWRSLQLEYCGTYMQVCTVLADGQADLYVPLPANSSPLRLAFPVKRSTC